MGDGITTIKTQREKYLRLKIIFWLSIWPQIKKVKGKCLGQEENINLGINYYFKLLLKEKKYFEAADSKEGELSSCLKTPEMYYH